MRYWVLFVGVLAAVFLRALADALASRTALSPNHALAAVTLVLLAVVVGFGVAVAPEVAVQIDELRDRTPEVINIISDGLTQYRWGVAFIE